MDEADVLQIIPMAVAVGAALLAICAMWMAVRFARRSTRDAEFLDGVLKQLAQHTERLEKAFERFESQDKNNIRPKSEMLKSREM